MLFGNRTFGIAAFFILAVALAGFSTSTFHYKKKAEKAELGLRIVESKFEGCQSAVMQLHEQSREREEKAAQALKEARSVAADYQLRADRLLRQPAAVPGNDCASAKVRARAWLEGRK